MNKIIAVKQEVLHSSASLLTTTKSQFVTWSDPAIENYLVNCVKSGDISGFPSVLQKELQGYILVYQTAVLSKNPPLIRETEELIHTYAEKVGVWTLRDLIAKDEKCSPTRLQHIGEHLGGTRYHVPKVKLTIKDGKIAWQFVQGTEVLKDAQNQPIQNGHPILDTDKVVIMTLEQFVEFKNAGKRFSNVAISAQRYQQAIDHIRHNSRDKRFFTKLNLPTHADLLTGGVLNDHNCFSYSFRQMSAEKIAIKYPYSSTKPDQANFLTQVLQYCVSNPAWGKKSEFIIEGQALVLDRTRLEKSPKKLAGTGRVTFDSDLGSTISKWDVGTYKELNAFKRHDDLEFDHVPQHSTVKKIFKTKKSMADESLCLAIETRLHKTGATHGSTDPDADTYQNFGPPMLKDIQTHLENLEKEGQLTLQAIGSMRTLYSQNVKHRFPGSGLQALDSLLLEYLEKVSR